MPVSFGGPGLTWMITDEHTRSVAKAEGRRPFAAVRMRDKLRFDGDQVTNCKVALSYSTPGDGKPTASETHSSAFRRKPGFAYA